jgi:DNA-directed RNA polymerase subunit RPC12/RpoP
MENNFKFNKQIIAYGQNCMNCKKKIRGQDNYFMEYLGIVCFECSNMSKVKYYLKIIEILQNKIKCLKLKLI